MIINIYFEFIIIIRKWYKYNYE